MNEIIQEWIAKPGFIQGLQAGMCLSAFMTTVVMITAGALRMPRRRRRLPKEIRLP